MSRAYFENECVSQELNTSVEEWNTITIFVLQELKVRILRICYWFIWLLVILRILQDYCFILFLKNPLHLAFFDTSLWKSYSNRISIARNEILRRRYVASSRAYYQRMTKIPEI